jgi:hypothetical protein
VISGEGINIGRSAPNATAAGRGWSARLPKFYLRRPLRALRQTIQLTEEELSLLNKNMPKITPSFLESCTCGMEHTEEAASIAELSPLLQPPEKKPKKTGE